MYIILSLTTFRETFFSLNNFYRNAIVYSRLQRNRPICTVFDFATVHLYQMRIKFKFY